MHTLLPDAPILFVVLVAFFTVGLISKTWNGLVTLWLVACVLHFALVVLLPYFSDPSKDLTFPGGLVPVAIVAYATAVGAAFVGYGVRTIISRLLGRASSQ